MEEEEDEDARRGRTRKKKFYCWQTTFSSMQIYSPAPFQCLTPANLGQSLAPPSFLFPKGPDLQLDGGGREGGKRISLPHQTTSQKKRREKSPPFSLLFWVYKCGIFGGSGRRSRKIAQGIRKGDKDKEKNLVTFHTFFPCQGNGRNIAAQEREGNLVQDDGLFKGMGKEIVSRGKDFF